MNITLQRGDREPEPEPESLLSADFTQRLNSNTSRLIYSEVNRCFVGLTVGLCSAAPSLMNSCIHVTFKDKQIPAFSIFND